MGVKIPGAVTNAANFVAGTIGSAAEQGIGRGRASIGRSILGGIDNMIGNSRYGTSRLENLKNATVRGVKAGAANAGLGYFADLVDPAHRLDVSGAAGLMAGMAGSLLMRDPRRCGSPSPFHAVLGYSMAKGYQYGVSRTGFGRRKKPSLMGFIGETMRGAVTGGVTSAAFYGVGKGINRLKENLQNLGKNSADWYSPLSLNLGEANDKVINAAIEIAGPSTVDEFKVFGHGNPKGIRYKEQILNADEVAHLIRNSPQYVGGNQKVKLYACDTGKDKNGFAQQLADNLGVMVEAPNRKLFPTRMGDFIVADKILWSKGIYIRGSWVQYSPRRYF